MKKNHESKKIFALSRHPYLLHDKESLSTVLEVVELGISGSKSQSRASDPPIFKEDKSPLPASRRVRDAAEGLLNLILEEVRCETLSKKDPYSLIVCNNRRILEY